MKSAKPPRELRPRLSANTPPTRRRLPRPAPRARLDVEQAEQLVLVQAQRRRRGVLADHLLEQGALLLQDLGDAPLDGVLRDEARHEDRLLLAQAVRPVDRLVLDGGVPPA